MIRDVIQCMLYSKTAMQHIINNELPESYRQGSQYTIATFVDGCNGDWIVESDNKDIINALKAIVKSYYENNSTK